jgi:penicillin-binding protein 1A
MNDKPFDPTSRTSRKPKMKPVPVGGKRTSRSKAGAGSAAAPSAGKKRGFFSSGLFKGLALATVGLGIIGAIAAAVIISQLMIGLPSIEALKSYEPKVTTRVHAGDGKLIAEFARERRVFVPIEEMPDTVVNAFISAEDKSFFEHSGLDFMGMGRAAIRNVLNQLSGSSRLQGASTITQQVARVMLLSPEQTYIRKAREALLAYRIEQAMSKDKILEIYLNEIYLGGRSYGVASAALNYFGKSLSELTIDEAAYLAALPKAPSTYAPARNYERAKGRRDWVVERMRVNGYITEAEAKTATDRPLELIKRMQGPEYAAAAYSVEEVRRESVKLFGEKELYDGGLSIRSTLDTNMQLAAQVALKNGLEAYDRRHGWRGPASRLESMDDWAAQLDALHKAGRPPWGWRHGVVLKASEASVDVGLADGTRRTLNSDDVKWARTTDKRGGAVKGLAARDVVFVELPEVDPSVAEAVAAEGQDDEAAATSAPVKLKQVPAANGALVAIDAHTGRVLAMAGGYSFRTSQFNRATQAMRQPGSSFKPFVYAAALENGFTPSSLILDAAFVSCDPTQDECYKPQNYSEQFYGMSTLRLGVEKSRNAMTVRLAQEIGLNKVSEIGERFGIYDDLPPYLAMSLGAGETTLMRMVSAYASLVNGGKKVTPSIIDRVQDRQGKTVYKRDTRPCIDCLGTWNGQGPMLPPDLREQIMDPIVAYQTVSLLEGVVERGTGAAIRSVGRPLGGKTGTTDDFIDAWFVGFSPDVVVGVYIGFDTPATLGEGESGGRAAVPVFRDFMTVALKEQPVLPFRIPAGVRLVPVDAKTGRLPDASSAVVIMEAFRPGTEPQVGQAEGEGGLVIFGRGDVGGLPAAGRPGANQSATSDDREEDLGGLY